MSKVLLVQPPWYILQNIKNETFLSGLGYIAAVLKKAGHEVMIFNGEPPILDDCLLQDKGIIVDIEGYQRAHHPTNFIWERFREAMESFEPDFAGISMWTAGYRSALNIAALAKEFNPDLPVFVGGVHPTLLPVEILEKNPDIDYVVKGEGEYTAAELITALEKRSGLNKICGIYFREGDKITNTPSRAYIENLDSLPFPDFENVFDKELYNPDAFGSVITSRGCPYSCSYCASNRLWGRKTRFRSPQSVVDEVSLKIKSYKTRGLRFNDDSFTVDRQRVMDICRLLLERRIDIAWQCDIRADLIDENLLGIMKKAGCRQVNIGVESGNADILKSINKNISLAQVKKAAGMVKSASIRFTMYFMMGFPGETEAQIEETARLMEELRPHWPCWSLVTPYPGTELYEFAGQNGLLPDQNDWSLFFHHSPLMKLTKEIDYPQWLELIDKIQVRVDKIIAFHQKRDRLKDLFSVNKLRAIPRFIKRRLLKFAGTVKIYFKPRLFILLNKTRKKTTRPNVYYGDISECAGDFTSPAILRIKKLLEYFPNTKKGFNIIYTNGYEPDYETCLVAKRSGIPVIININGLHYKAWYGPGWKKQNKPVKYVYEIADYVIFQSRFSRLSAERFLGKPDGKWDIVYNAVDTEKFSPRAQNSSKKDRLVLLCAGNHLSFHRLEIPVRALKALIQKGVKSELIIAGPLNRGRGYFNVDGRIQRLIKKLGLEGFIRFSGAYTQKDAAQIYHSAHILVHMQYNDVCPTTVIEAMACGLPAVYSQSGGTPEIVGSDAGIGLPVETDWDNYRVPKVQDVADAIMRVAEDKDVMSQAARNRAVQYFDIKRWIECHRHIFNLLLK